MPASRSGASRAGPPDVLRAVVNSLPAMIGYWDRDLHNVVANDAYLDFFGFTPEAMRGLHIREVLGEELYQRNRPFIELALSGQVQLFDREIVDTEGRTRYTQASYIPDVVDGEVLGFFALVTDITARRHAELALQASEERFRLMVEGVEDYAIFMLGPEGHILTWNVGAERIKGYRPDEIVGQHFSIFYPSEDLVGDKPGRELQLAATFGHFEDEGWRLRKGGERFWANVVITALRHADGSLRGFAKITRDLTERRAAEVRLAASEARFAAMVERSSDLICLTDAGGVLGYASPAIRSLLGFAPDSQVGRPLLDLVHPDDAVRVGDTLAELLGEADATVSIEARLATVEGRWRHVDLTATNRLDDAEVLGVVVNIRDVTERAEAAARLQWHALHDSLTGLPNRALLLDRLRHALEHARRHAGHTALLFIDLDRFKTVNDTFGHQIGDELLVEVAARLSRCVRAEDTAARIGGDEFIVLAEALRSRDEAAQLAERVRSVLATPCQLSGVVVEVTASIGLAFDDDHRPETLLSAADNAMHRAKAHGKDRFQVFDAALRAEATRRVSAEAVLRRALDDDTVAAHYQPIFDLVTGSAVAAEALLRLPGPAGGAHTPVELVTVAEDTGLIVSLGATILDRACAQLAAWKAADPAGAPRHVGVNVAARQLSRPGFAAFVRATLARHALTADELVLELTESTIISADRSTASAVEGLHEIGVRLAVDDFGTGYASLVYLKRFPIQMIKIDRSFVSGLGAQANDTAIVEAVIALGHTLGMATIAEGIETAEQLDALRRLGCDYGQGFLLAHPVPPEDLLAAVAAGRRARWPSDDR